MNVINYKMPITLKYFVDTIYDSFEKSYECSFNYNVKTNEIINFRTTKDNDVINHAINYPDIDNIINFHTHSDNIDNLLSYIPSYTDILNLIENNYFEYTKDNINKKKISAIIISSIKENDKTKVVYLNYYIGDDLERIYKDRYIIAAIFHNISIDYYNNHKDFNKFIKDYKNSNLSSYIILHPYKTSDLI